MNGKVCRVLFYLLKHLLNIESREGWTMEKKAGRLLGDGGNRKSHEENAAFCFTAQTIV